MGYGLWGHKELDMTEHSTAQGVYSSAETQEQLGLGVSWLSCLLLADLPPRSLTLGTVFGIHPLLPLLPSPQG